MPVSQAEIDARARSIREAGVPDLLNRWLELTPELVARNEEFLARLRAEAITWGRSNQESTMSSPGKKEAQLRDLRVAGETEAATATRRAETTAVDATKGDQPQAPRSARKTAQEADAADLAMVGRAVSFTMKTFKDGAWQELAGIATLELARSYGEKAEAGHSRKSMIYAVLADGRAVLVPRDFQPAPSTEGTAMDATTTTKPAAATPVPAPATVKPAAAKPVRAKTAPAKPAAKKPAAKKAAAKKSAAKKPKTAKAKAPVKPKAKSKLDVVHDMLTRENGATRKQLSEASGWPYVNLKASAERVDMDLICLNKDDGRFKLVPKKGAAAKKAEAAK
jgi:hypothetical protein